MINKIIEKFFRIFNIPAIAVRYFRLSNKLSGLNKSNFPKELVPLNTRQLSRGMLNYTFIQHFPGWKLPYWAVRQYDVNSNSFIPRSHLGVSVNVTHRNWTAIGNLNCNTEPIVDPCGAVVPFNDGWSLECWIKSNDRLIVPAYLKNVHQTLIDDLPIVKTTIVEQKFDLVIKHYTSHDNLISEYVIENKSSENISLDLLLAIRPFNPEGVSLIDSLNYSKNENSFFVNGVNKILFSEQPEKVILSNLKSGDSVNQLFIENNQEIITSIECEYGFANGISVFPIELNSNQKKLFTCYTNLNNTSIDIQSIRSLEQVVEDWNSVISNKTYLTIPDLKVSSLIRSSLCTSIQLLDSDKLTPGPAIYHQFWIRDAAFQLNTLDKFGYNSLSKQIFNTFFDYQKSDGCFQSQKGEWDSTGQVLWMTMQNALLSNDLKYLQLHFKELYKSVQWIDKKRQTDKKYSVESHYGLLPKGLSAEHLGLADYYYWDNFWSIAGIKSFGLICQLLNEDSTKQYTQRLLEEYEKTLYSSIERSIRSNIFGVIPSAPNKDLDTGMIGTISAIYPLQILDWENENFKRSLNYIFKNYFNKNLFYQNIIHSGGNPYITLQIAHSFLYLGKRELFNKILNDVVACASTTLNYPEAIHPITGGGVIGDGHHGWAAAEVLLAMRDAFVYEKDYYLIESIELILLSGIPKEWFLSGKEFKIVGAPVLSGKVSISILLEEKLITLRIDYSSNGYYSNEKIKIVLPFVVKNITGDLSEYSISISKTETTITSRAQSLLTYINIEI